MRRCKHCLAPLIAAAVFLCALPAAAKGLPADWSAAEIEEALALDFVPEELQDDYEQPITRAEFAKIALFFAALQYNVDDERDYLYLNDKYVYFAEPFSDCFDYYVSAARRVQIVDGVGDNRYEPDRAITRAEAAKLLCNTYSSYGGTTAGRETGTASLEEFADRDEIPSWAEESVADLLAWGVMRGVEDSRFVPSAPYTRAQCIVTFLRLYKQAPDSRYHEGIAMCPLSPEELLADILDSISLHERQRIVTDFCTIFDGYQSGLPHGSRAMLWVIYDTGGRRSPYRVAPSHPIERYASDFGGVRLDEAQMILYFGRTVDDVYYEYGYDLRASKIVSVTESHP